MESNIQSSFIPHDTAAPVALRRGGGLPELALILGILAFAVSAALAAAVFLYLQYLSATASSDLAQLDRAQQQFQPALVQQLERLDDRMHAASDILNAHLAPSAFFQALDQLTAQTISFSSLQIDATDPGDITLKAQGVADTVNSIAFEADTLGKSGAFKNPIFSGLDRQQDGVHFNLTAAIDPATINYVQLTGGQAAGAGAPAPAASAPAASSSPFGGAPPSPSQ